MCFCWEEESLVILNTVHHPCWQTTFETMDGKQNTHQLKSHFILESFFAALRCVNSPIIFSHEETLRRCHEHHSTCLQADWSEQETKYLPFSEKKIPLFTDWHIPTPPKEAYGLSGGCKCGIIEISSLSSEQKDVFILGWELLMTGTNVTSSIFLQNPANISNCNGIKHLRSKHQFRIS